MPELPTASQKADSILIGTNSGSILGGDGEEMVMSAGGKWEDEEERRFFEEIQDLKDFVPRGVLGIEEDTETKQAHEEKDKREKERMEEEVRKIDEELEGLSRQESEQRSVNGVGIGSEAEHHTNEGNEVKDDEEE
jgi:regulator of nonsense transcripts 2